VARFVTFNGITLVHPGGATKVDVSQLAQVSAGVTGIVALIGEADGGQPNEVSDVSDINAGLPKIYSFTEGSTAKEVFRSGPLADAINLAFDAANDPRIPGGAQKVLAIKTNQSTASTAVLTAEHGTGQDVIDLFSTDYGVSTNGLTFEIVVSPGDTNHNQLDMSIVTADGVVEDITDIGDKPLLNIQYKGPDSPTVFATGTMTSPVAGVTVTDTAGAFGIDVRGKWLVITSVPDATDPAGAGDLFARGQVRRIVGSAATTLTLDAAFLDDAGNVDNLTGTGGTAESYGYSIIHEVVGPFPAATVAGANNETITINGIPDTDQTGKPLVFFTPNGAGGTTYFDGPTNGPNYIKIVSGPGAGQIRQIASSSSSLVTDAVTITIDVVDTLGWSPVPVAGASEFMLINLSSGSATPFGGALAYVEGASGVADTLFLLARPGFGELDGAGAAGTTVILNAAGTPVLDKTYNLLSDLNDTSTGITTQLLVDRINTGSNAIEPTNPPTTLTAGGYKARVGTSRSGTLLASRLDWVDGYAAPAWTGGVNQAVNLAVGFDLSWSNTFGVDDGNLNVTPVSRHRLLDSLEQVIDAINQSTYIRAVKQVVGAQEGSGVPQLNELPVILTTGTTGTTSATDLLNAFDQLIKHRHTTVVPLWSRDSATLSIAAVHAATLSHTQLGKGAGKNEIDAILALDVSATTDPNSNANALTELLNAQADLNNENCGIVYERVERLNVDGVVTMFEPHMMAVLLAGMQAGSAIGEPLTYKYINATDIDYPVQLDPLDKSVSDQLLLSGILVVEPIEGKGFRVAKNISTYTKSDNLAFTDRNVREVLNHIAYDLRTGIEDRFTGLKATPATALSIKNFVNEKMQAYKDEELIVDSSDPITGARINAWKNVRVTISGDIATIKAEFFPVIGINYELITLFAQLPTISA